MYSHDAISFAGINFDIGIYIPLFYLTEIETDKLITTAQRLGYDVFNVAHTESLLIKNCIRISDTKTLFELAGIEQSKAPIL